MAFTLFPIAFVPKPAGDSGKFDSQTVYHGDFPKKSGAHAKQNPQTVRGNFKRERLIMAIAKENAIGLAKPFESLNLFGLVKQKGIALIVGAIAPELPLPSASSPLKARAL